MRSSWSSGKCPRHFIFKLLVTALLKLLTAKFYLDYKEMIYIYAKVYFHVFNLNQDFILSTHVWFPLGTYIIKKQNKQKLLQQRSCQHFCTLLRYK